MKRNKRQEKWFLAIGVIVLIFLVVIMILKVSDIQGYAKVINYTGRARGATQRLIKQEFYGYENDELILTLDDILDELYTGEGKHGLRLIEDHNYRGKLETQINVWNRLKDKIYAMRVDSSNSEELYLLSEKYYDIADATVNAAEAYSEHSSLELKYLESVIIIVSITIMLIFLMISYDLIHLAHMNKKLNEVAYIDMQTGLPNRSSCDIKMTEFGMLTNGQDICCLMFDLNNLKITNDKLGHAAGDSLIINFAYILRESAPKRMFIGRFGGDEFIGIINNTTEKEILAFIKRLTENVEEQNQKKDTFKISYAYGYAMASSYDEITIKALLAQADIEMYQMKAKMKSMENYTNLYSFNV